MPEEEKKKEEVEEKEDTESEEEEETKDKKRKTRRERETEEAVKSWKPITKLGKLVKKGKIVDMDDIIKDYKILEPEIVDFLIMPKIELINIGQSKGKYGGGKRRVFKQTQKKTAEGNVLTFSTMAVAGDMNGHVGIGMGKAKETFPSRDKAIKKAKLNMIRVERGCGSFNCSCSETHSIPFQVEGKSGSSKIVLIPAPQGTGLVVGDACKDILRLAGITDVYSKTYGQTRQSINLAKACINALKKTIKFEK